MITSEEANSGLIDLLDRRTQLFDRGKDLFWSLGIVWACGIVLRMIDLIFTIPMTAVFLLALTLFGSLVCGLWTGVWLLVTCLRIFLWKRQGVASC